MKNIRKKVVRVLTVPSLYGGVYRSEVELACRHVASISHSQYALKVPKTTICNKCSVANDIAENSPGQEWFEILGTRFDVTKAKAFIAGRVPNGTINVANFQGFASMIWIDEKRAMSDAVDLTWPMIVANLAPDMLPIDGWHRFHKASKLGIEKLDCHVLTEEETFEVVGSCVWKDKYIARKEAERLARVEELDTFVAEKIGATV